jgi:hypothetical protein
LFSFSVCSFSHFIFFFSLYLEIVMNFSNFQKTSMKNKLICSFEHLFFIFNEIYEIISQCFIIILFVNWQEYFKMMNVFIILFYLCVLFFINIILNKKLIQTNKYKIIFHSTPIVYLFIPVSEKLIDFYVLFSHIPLFWKEIKIKHKNNVLK